jgi:hypothetical protein
MSQLLSLQWCCTFVCADVFKTIPEADSFSVPTWDSSRAKVALGHQKDSWVQSKISSAKKKETWLTHLFRAMDVPGYIGECSKGRVVQERRGFDELNAKLQALNFKVSGVRKKKQRIQ